MHLPSTTVYLREKKILTNENVHHSDNVTLQYEEKMRYQEVGFTGFGFKVFFTLP